VVLERVEEYGIAVDGIEPWKAIHARRETGGKRKDIKRKPKI